MDGLLLTMPCTIVVGGQFGSEGKGKAVALLSMSVGAPWAVRCGGPNSGHTTVVEGKEIVLRQLPAGVANPRAMLAIAAGCVVDESVLLREIDLLGIERERIVVDPRAVLLERADVSDEGGLVRAIGSTASGTGAALARRMGRGPGVRLVADATALSERVRIEAVAPLLHDHLAIGGDVVVEGTQGFALSLWHGDRYPFVTARDTTAAAFASEVGLSPFHVDRVCMVLRTYPIRVGGASGPFPNEIDWETLRVESGAPHVVEEMTSVTKRLRRVARFHLDSVVTASRYNGATELAVMGLDRIDYSNTGAKSIDELSSRGRRFLQELESATGVPVGWVGTGFRTTEAIYLGGRQLLSARDLHAPH
jgi:adenylosuccinate synthase